MKADLWVSLSCTTLLNSSYSFDIFGILTGDHRVYMLDFYRLVDGYEEKAKKVQDIVCQKMVLDMHCESQVQCVINYHASNLGITMSKKESRIVKLTREQYESVKYIILQLDGVI